MRQDAARLWAWGKRHLLKALVAALAVLSVALAVVMACKEPGWAFYLLGLDLLGPEDATRKTRAIELIGIAMGGALLAIGATIANRRAVAMEDTVRSTEKGLRQERLKTAIEHLGHPSDSVRMGGAYELFHLAQDNEDLRRTALDILCAHIRRTTGEAEYRSRHADKPSTEVQSLLTLLFVQEHEVFEGCRIDLQGSWLKGANLFRARLRGASLYEASLQGASFIEAYLQGALLIGACLHRAHLIRACLQGAHLYSARLQSAELARAHLQGANLSFTRLQGAELSWAHLQGAELSWAHLQGANLTQAQLQGARLSKAQLHGASSHSGGYEPSFERRIDERIGRKSDLLGVVFAGGLSRDDVASLVKDLPDEKAEALRQSLGPHIGKPASHELPEGCGAITGGYTKQEAKRWIAEYEEAMGRRPQTGGG